MSLKPVVGVMGGGSCTELECKYAYGVGRGIAERGWVLLTGGRTGVMEAASKGAAEAGGIVVGILPGTSLDEANRYVQIALPTGLLDARNAINTRASWVVIAIGGGAGTLSEIALALKMGKPTIGLRTCKFTLSDGTVPPNYHEVETPQQALKLAEQFVNAIIEQRGKA